MFRIPRWSLIIALVLMVAGLSGGCAPSNLKADFNSADPTTRIHATERAVRTNDKQALPDLIAGLASDDPAVRFMSIHALEQITGETMGYRYHDPEWERREAIARWVEMYPEGDLRNPTREAKDDLAIEMVDQGSGLD